MRDGGPLLCFDLPRPAEQAGEISIVSTACAFVTPGTPLVTLPAKIGIRESRHARCLHTLTQDELLSGKRFPDAVANGCYRVDIHHPDRPGVTFRSTRMPLSGLGNRKPWAELA